MRAPLLVLLLLGVPLAGCLDESGASRAPNVAGDIIAYHDGPSREGPNRTLFVLRDGDAFQRVTYFYDRAEMARAASGTDLAADLDTLFRPADGTLGRDVGGLVLRVEHGRVPDAQRAALRAVLGQPLPAGDARADPFMVGAAVVTLEPPRHVWRSENERADAAPLFAAFEAAEAAFVAERVDEARLPSGEPVQGCVEPAVRVEEPAVLTGEPVVIVASVTNCGNESVELALTPCGSAPLFGLQVAGSMMLPRTLPQSPAPAAAMAIDLRCDGEGARLPLPPGETREVRSVWNGSFGACRNATTCAYTVATPGNYHVHAFVMGTAESASAEVILLPDEAPDMPFLLVKERHWLNATGEPAGHVQGHFGGHCAPATYTLDPPTLTLRFDGEDPPGGARGMVVRDHREGPLPNHTSTMSADRIDLLKMGAGAAARIVSPWDDATTYANVTLAGASFIVDGERLDVGASTTLHRGMDVRNSEGGAYRAESVLVVTNVGLAQVLREPMFGCA